MWTKEDGARYLRNNLEVLRAYERSDKRMGPTLYAQRHWEKIGQHEGRKSGPELDPTLKRTEYPDDYFTKEAIAARAAEDDKKAVEIRAKPLKDRTLFENDWLRQYDIKKDPLRGLKLVPSSQIAAAFRRANPYLSEAWQAMSFFDQATKYGWWSANFILANPNLKPGDVPLPRLTADEVKALQVKYTLEM